MKPAVNRIRTIVPMLFAIALVISSCSEGVIPPYESRTWVAIDPVQCLGNPWERDWLERHGNAYQDYPGEPGAQERIIREYYSRLGVDVGEILSIPRYPVTCRACSCPRGDALYLHVRESDADRMLRLGFRRELPYPFPFPRDSALIGIYRYNGFDSSGSVLLIGGTLDIIRRDSSFVSGAWSLRGPDGYGPQIGTGSFTGEIHGTKVVLNLNPGWADNNVMLRGELNAGIYAGRWDVITIAGVVYTGDFIAVKTGMH